MPTAGYTDQALIWAIMFAACTIREHGEVHDVEQAVEGDAKRADLMMKQYQERWPGPDPE